MSSLIYPFAAIVGQERVKRALLINLVDPGIGGVLLSGQKGTAKSTVARALAELGDMKLINVPLSVTEDMLVGSADFELLIKEDILAFSEGLLKKADGNILYIDEVNLLPDNAVSIIENVAANGENIVEREGFSTRHKSRFVLIGSMNPEEGRLRPQLLDRFGLYVNVTGEKDPEKRSEIIRRRLLYENDPGAFRESFQEETVKLRQQISSAAELKDKIVYSSGLKTMVSEIINDAAVQGNRAELILLKTAGAIAALDGRKSVEREDILEAASFVLPHRKGNLPEEEKPQPPERRPEPENNESTSDPGGQSENRRSRDLPPPSPDDFSKEDNDSPASEEQLERGSEFYKVIKLIEPAADSMPRSGTGKRIKTVSRSLRGRYIGSSFSPTESKSIAMDATIRAAAPYQKGRSHEKCALSLLKSDIRYKVCESRTGATVIFAVDASGSMGARRRMKAVKEAIISMLLDSYQKRDRVALISFRKTEAELLLDITGSAELAEKKLQELPTGGRTPLALGLMESRRVIKNQLLKDKRCRPVLVLVTDGRATVPLFTQDPIADALHAAGLLAEESYEKIVIDTESSYVPLGIARQLAQRMGAVYKKTEELKDGELRDIMDTFIM